MGMFDYVEYKARCNNCGEMITEFQSKDYLCELNTVTPDKVNNFYGRCDNCANYQSYKVNKVSIVQSIEEMSR